MQGRTIQKVSFTSFEGLRVKATYSLPASSAASTPGACPREAAALLLVDHRKGIPVWGNEQPLERNQWGDRAVLIVETLDRGSRALERNLRSFSDDDLLHHMKRQAMVAGTTLESMQVYELLRSLGSAPIAPEGRSGQDHDHRQGRRRRERHVRRAARRERAARDPAFAAGLPPSGPSLSGSAPVHGHPRNGRSPG